jgi:hypothetical protein
MTDNIPASTFSHLGRALADRRHNACQRSDEYERRRFKAFYGTSADKCSRLWWMIHHTAKSYQEIGGGAQPQHLLWALMWLKTYNTDIYLSGVVGVDENTFRKWYWKFVMAISFLKDKIVSCGGSDGTRRGDGASVFKFSCREHAVTASVSAALLSALADTI